MRQAKAHEVNYSHVDRIEKHNTRSMAQSWGRFVAGRGVKPAEMEQLLMAEVEPSFHADARKAYALKLKRLCR